MISAVNVGFYNLLKLWPETSARDTAYAVGDVIKPTSYAGHSYKCTTAGTSHASVEPTWTTTNGNTTTDGTAVFTCFNSKTYQVKAPQGSTVPYVTFGLLTDVPMGTLASLTAMESLTYWVNCFSSKSTADVAEMADEVMSAMDGATLTVIGYTQIKCVREFIGSTIWDSETDIYQIPLRYRLWIDKD
jgi:hypothetical protein